MGVLIVNDYDSVWIGIVEYFPTMHDYNMVFGKFKLGSKRKDIGHIQRNGTEHQVQRISITIISRKLRSETKKSETKNQK